MQLKNGDGCVLSIRMHCLFHCLHVSSSCQKKLFKGVVGDCSNLFHIHQVTEWPAGFIPDLKSFLSSPPPLLFLPPDTHNVQYMMRMRLQYERVCQECLSKVQESKVSGARHRNSRQCLRKGYMGVCFKVWSEDQLTWIPLATTDSILTPSPLSTTMESTPFGPPPLLFSSRF